MKAALICSASIITTTINVLASLERIDEAPAAFARGYAPAITLAELPGDKAFAIDDLRVIPCPAETRGTNCVACRLCLDRDLVAMRSVIAFGMHGRAKARASRRLRVLRVAPGRHADGSATKEGAA